jgi:hypothetical protein
VVVRDFDFFGMGTLPAETNAILIVNADAVLAQTVPTKLFEAIARWGSELRQFANTVDLSQLCDARLARGLEDKLFELLGC